MTGHASFLPSSQFSENVSNNIWLYRVFLGLTHEELAERGKYSSAQLAQMEAEPVRIITDRPLYWLLLDAETRQAIETARLRA